MSFKQTLLFPASIIFMTVFALAAPPAILAGEKDYRESDIATLQSLMEQGQLSAMELVQFYIDRIKAIDQQGPMLRSMT